MFSTPLRRRLEPKPQLYSVPSFRLAGLIRNRIQEPRYRFSFHDNLTGERAGRDLLDDAFRHRLSWNLAGGRHLEPAGVHDGDVVLTVCFNVMPQLTQRLDGCCTVFLLLGDRFPASVFRCCDRTFKGLDSGEERIQIRWIRKQLRMRFDPIMRGQCFSRDLGIAYAAIAERYMKRRVRWFFRPKRFSFFCFFFLSTAPAKKNG